MKVQLMSDEVQELADLLAGDDRELIHEIARTEHGDFKHGLQHREDVLIGLRGKLTRNEVDFSGPELDFLRDVLEHHERILYAEISRTDHREFKHSLQQKLDRIVQLRKKIAELCAAA
jgi:hypothetical protein